MVASPTARPICTPTPYLCLALPKVCSLIKENARVIAGFVPNPRKKNPKPMILGESAIIVATIATIPMIQAILIAPFLPELSAILGITKKPMSAPKKSIDCRIGIWPSN